MKLLLWPMRVACLVCIAALVFGWQPSVWENWVAYWTIFLLLYATGKFCALAESWRRLALARVHSDLQMVAGEVLRDVRGAPH